MTNSNPNPIQINEATALITAQPSDLDYKVTPLPQPQFFILLIVRFSEPLAFSILFPFIYFMVKDFGITDDEAELGYYVGTIASCFAIAQTCTSIFWGSISDRIGRKPVVIFGLIGSSISLILFGLSKSLTWAILTRSLSGILNGNVGVVKTMVGEMTDKSNRAKGFSYLPMMFGLGNIVGPVIGGFLAKPAEQFPDWFGRSVFWTKYPYFLPCAFAGVLNILNAFIAHYFLEETLKPRRSDSRSGSDSESLIDTNPQSPLQIHHNSSSISRESKMVMVGFSLLSLSSVMFNELIVLWSATEIAKGGLSFAHQDIAKALSVTGVAILFVQMVTYPRLQRWLGTLKLYRSVFPIHIIICILIPMVNVIAKQGNISLMWISLLAVLVMRATCNTLGITSINILLVESADATGNLGLLNGVSQTLGGLCRSIGPALCGIVYSYSMSYQLPYPFDFHLVWYIMAFLCFLNYCNSFNIK